MRATAWLLILLAIAEGRAVGHWEAATSPAFPWRGGVWSELV